MKNNRRNTSTRAFAAAAALTLFAIAPAFSNSAPPIDRGPPGPFVQLALLLDTSNSMDGLIDQARSRLWQIVNELACARRDGVQPRLEVALYEYGNNSLSRESGFIREVCQFTSDLDLLSQHLFSLRTNGGDEFCGTVIDRALRNLAWRNHPADLRMIFIAGNEPFTQGPVDFRPVVKRAAARGISVNTIFCGPENEGVVTHWQNGAVLAGGTYASIDQDRCLPRIDAPQDRELALLNEKLNSTYLAYGAAGRRRADMQRVQDENASAAAPAAIASRIASKASSLYQNSTWDLVDAARDGSIDADRLEEKELPAELRGLAPEARKKKIDMLAQERARVQEAIKTLSKKREEYVATELKKQTEAGAAAALDEAILESIRQQAAEKKYEFTK